VFVVISGPEKAGKTTLIDTLVKHLPPFTVPPFVRHWSGPANDQRNTRFIPALQADYAAEMLGQAIIWDRSWLCHNVYGFLMQHPHNETVKFPLLSEWLYGRAVDHLGSKFVLLPQSWQDSHKRRDDSDLPVHARFEYQMYKSLAESYGWTILENDYSPERLSQNVQTILDAVNEHTTKTRRLEELVSPPSARVCFVGEKPEESYDKKQGEWLPFTHKQGIQFAQSLGDYSLKAAWAFSHRLPPGHLRDYETLVTFGELPYLWAKNYVGHKNVIALPRLPHVVSRKYDAEWPNISSMLIALIQGDREGFARFVRKEA